MKFKVLFLISIAVLISSCSVEDDFMCINSFDCENGFECINGICIEQQNGVPDADNAVVQDESVNDSSQNDNAAVNDTEKNDTEKQDDAKPDTETPDEPDNVVIPDENTGDPDIYSPDETADNDLSDDLSDEVSDTESDETPDVDNNTGITCGTLTCGAHSYCDDTSGTPKCVCESFYQDMDNNGTCLESCSLYECNDTAWGAANFCDIKNGAPTCDCETFAGYTGTHCTECRSGFHAGGFGYEDECFDDTCEEATDTFHGWLDCWEGEVCQDTFGYAECVVP